MRIMARMENNDRGEIFVDSIGNGKWDPEKDLNSKWKI